MTMHEELPVVDIDEILRDQDNLHTPITRAQWLLVIGGGIIGVTGLLITLVLAAPAILDLMTWIHAVQRAVNG